MKKWRSERKTRRGLNTAIQYNTVKTTKNRGPHNWRSSLPALYDPGGRKVVNLANPQTWNMYAYALDNPTTFNDPSGLQSPGNTGGGNATVGSSTAGDSCSKNPGAHCLNTNSNGQSNGGFLSLPGPPHWQYSQSSGSMNLKVGVVTIVHAGSGYAGHGKGLNNPASRSVSESMDKANAGPLPRGKYTIGQAQNTRLGSPSMHLTPSPSTNMEGRGKNSFWIHADNIHRAPLSSSEGCIVLPARQDRGMVAGSGIEVLIVVR